MGCDNGPSAVSAANDLIVSIELIYGPDSTAVLAVRKALTLSRRSKRPRQSIETMPFIALVSRLIRRAGERVGDSDEPELAALLGLQETLDHALQTAVDGQRAIGRSWAHIGRATGMAKQSAHERWGFHD